MSTPGYSLSSSADPLVREPRIFALSTTSTGLGVSITGRGFRVAVTVKVVIGVAAVSVGLWANASEAGIMTGISRRLISPKDLFNKENCSVLIWFDATETIGWYGGVAVPVSLRIQTQWLPPYTECVALEPCPCEKNWSSSSASAPSPN